VTPSPTRSSKTDECSIQTKKDYANHTIVTVPYAIQNGGKELSFGRSLNEKLPKTKKGTGLFEEKLKDK
jgi:hypothetical protein